MTRVAARPLLGRGQVRHARLRPQPMAFAYRTYFLLLPMRSLREQPATALRRNRFGLVSFHDADHGDGRADSLAWLEQVLLDAGIGDASGEVWLHCFPRVLGHAFKPVSFWYCHRHDDSLAAIVVEVNNTFGERHCYLLAGEALCFGRTLTATKVFHVSPFCETRGAYAFRFMRTDLAARDERGRNAVRVELHVDGAPLLLTSVSGRVEPLTRSAVRFALWTLPAMTAVIVARIHWHALRLWLKKLAIVGKPAPPAAGVTRGAPSDSAPQYPATTTRPSPTAGHPSSAQNPA